MTCCRLHSTSFDYYVSFYYLIVCIRVGRDCHEWSLNVSVIPTKYTTVNFIIFLKMTFMAKEGKRERERERKRQTERDRQRKKERLTVRY